MSQADSDTVEMGRGGSNGFTGCESHQKPFCKFLDEGIRTFLLVVVFD